MCHFSWLFACCWFVCWLCFFLCCCVVAAEILSLQFEVSAVWTDKTHFQKTLISFTTHSSSISHVQKLWSHCVGCHWVHWKAGCTVSFRTLQPNRGSSSEVCHRRPEPRQAGKTLNLYSLQWEDIIVKLCWTIMLFSNCLVFLEYALNWDKELQFSHDRSSLWYSFCSALLCNVMHDTQSIACLLTCRRICARPCLIPMTCKLSLPASMTLRACAHWRHRPRWWCPLPGLSISSDCR